MDAAIDGWVLRKVEFSDCRLRKKESAVCGVNSLKSSYLTDSEVYVMEKQIQLCELVLFTN